MGRGQGGGQKPSPRLHLDGGRSNQLHPLRPGKPTQGVSGAAAAAPDSRGGKGRVKLSPDCARYAAAPINCTCQDRVSPPERCRETRRFPDFIPQRRRVRREDRFFHSPIHWAAEKSFPLFFDVCGVAVRVEKCPSKKEKGSGPKARSPSLFSTRAHSATYLIPAPHGSF